MTTDRGVLFDVDGTLVDTAYLHAVTWHEALRQNGHALPMQAVHHAIGLGSDELLTHLLGEERDRSEDDHIKDAHSTLYKQHWGRLTTLPGARDLLRSCHAAGLRVVLSTSASEDELTALRSVIDCDDAIDLATSATDAGAGKPSPDVIELAMQKAGLVAADVVYVGDAVWDGVATARAGVPFIGVLSGGFSAADLRAAGALEVWHDTADLLANVATSYVSQLT